MALTSVYKKKTSAPSEDNSERQEIRALIVLMDDPDVFVQQKVNERLSGLEERHVPMLDQIREETEDMAIRRRVTDLIRKLTFSSFEQEFVEFLEYGVDNPEKLEKGLFLLSRIDNPTLRTDLYRRQLDKMALRLEPSVRTALSPGEKLQTFISFFFEHEFFKGAREDYMHPANSFLHKVLQRRRGIPIALSMVMLFVARRLDFPLHGVNMPLHFLLKYEVDNQSVYIDPFNNGRIVSLDQCSFFLRNHGITPCSSHFEKASEMDMLARSVRNLINGFDEKGEKERVGELKRLLGYIMQTRAEDKR